MNKEKKTKDNGMCNEIKFNDLDTNLQFTQMDAPEIAETTFQSLIKVKSNNPIDFFHFVYRAACDLLYYGNFNVYGEITLSLFQKLKQIIESDKKKILLETSDFANCAKNLYPALYAKLGHSCYQLNHIKDAYFFYSQCLEALSSQQGREQDIEYIKERIQVCSQKIFSDPHSFSENEKNEEKFESYSSTQSQARREQQKKLPSTSEIMEIIREFSKELRKTVEKIKFKDDKTKIKFLEELVKSFKLKFCYNYISYIEDNEDVLFELYRINYSILEQFSDSSLYSKSFLGPAVVNYFIKIFNNISFFGMKSFMVSKACLVNIKLLSLLVEDENKERLFHLYEVMRDSWRLEFTRIKQLDYFESDTHKFSDIKENISFLLIRNNIMNVAVGCVESKGVRLTTVNAIESLNNAILIYEPIRLNGKEKKHLVEEIKDIKIRLQNNVVLEKLKNLEKNLEDVQKSFSLSDQFNAFSPEIISYFLSTFVYSDKALESESFRIVDKVDEFLTRSKDDGYAQDNLDLLLHACILVRFWRANHYLFYKDFYQSQRYYEELLCFLKQKRVQDHFNKSLENRIWISILQARVEVNHDLVLRITASMSAEKNDEYGTKSILKSGTKEEKDNEIKINLNNTAQPQSPINIGYKKTEEKNKSFHGKITLAPKADLTEKKKEKSYRVIKKQSQQNTCGSFSDNRQHKYTYIRKHPIGENKSKENTLSALVPINTNQIGLFGNNPIKIYVNETFQKIYKNKSVDFIRIKGEAELKYLLLLPSARIKCRKIGELSFEKISLTKDLISQILAFLNLCSIEIQALNLSNTLITNEEVGVLLEFSHTVINSISYLDLRNNLFSDNLFLAETLHSIIKRFPFLINIQIEPDLVKGSLGRIMNALSQNAKNYEMIIYALIKNKDAHSLEILYQQDILSKYLDPFAKKYFQYAIKHESFECFQVLLELPSVKKNMPALVELIRETYKSSMPFLLTSQKLAEQISTSLGSQNQQSQIDDGISANTTTRSSSNQPLLFLPVGWSGHMNPLFTNYLKIKHLANQQVATTSPRSTTESSFFSIPFPRVPLAGEALKETEQPMLDSSQLMIRKEKSYPLSLYQPPKLYLTHGTEPLLNNKSLKSLTLNGEKEFKCFLSLPLGIKCRNIGMLAFENINLSFNEGMRKLLEFLNEHSIVVHRLDLSNAGIGSREIEVLIQYSNTIINSISYLDLQNNLLTIDESLIKNLVILVQRFPYLISLQIGINYYSAIHSKRLEKELAKNLENYSAIIESNISNNCSENLALLYQYPGILNYFDPFDRRYFHLAIEKESFNCLCILLELPSVKTKISALRNLSEEVRGGSIMGYILICQYLVKSNLKAIDTPALEHSDQEYRRSFVM